MDLNAIEHFEKVETDSVIADEFSVIVLAAGLSSRMGHQNKLLLNFNGQTLLRHCISSVTEAGLTDITVVLGHDRVNTEPELTGIQVQVVVNKEYEAGQMTSVYCGLSGVSGSSKATLICLSDQPHVTAAHLRNIMWAYDNRPLGKDIVVPVYEGDRGNPVCIGKSVREQVLSQGHNSNCRRYIDDNPELVYGISFNDPAFVADIDTPEQYAIQTNSKSRK